MREFAEQEIVLPTGPHQGRRFRCDRNPYSALWLNAIDSGCWRRFFATGPQQSGKTLCASIIPLLYHLFEVKETVIFGIPSLDMVADKWAEDIHPAIEASRYRELLPTSGAGSRGGTVRRVKFGNGVTLRFMTGGGSDKVRAGFTSRVLCLTEVDGMDESGGNSREADKITQLEGRTTAYGSRSLVYGECTVSLEDGRTWREYKGGTETRIVIRCPHCRAYTTPERGNLIGWRDSENEVVAGRKATIVCPECGVPWSEQDRAAANHDCLALHRGQDIKEGKVVGGAPDTITLGFRWNAANNLLVDTAPIAIREWKASRAQDEANAEKEMCQFVWAMPYKSGDAELSAGNASDIAKRMIGSPRGFVPADADFITLGIDIGQRLCHWVCIAWRPGATPHVVEYGRIEVPSDQFGVENALMIALRSFRDDVVKTGWKSGESVMHPKLKFVDAGWQDQIVSKFCEESGPDWLPTKGVGAARYSGPRSNKSSTGTKTVGIGENYHVAQVPGWRVPLVEVQSDHWKSWLHLRLQTPVGQPGALTIHQGGLEHLSYTKHLTAEKRIEEFQAGQGLIVRWEAINRNNHYLDATCLACVAGHAAGARLIIDCVAVKPPGNAPRIETKDGRGSGSNWVTDYKGRY